MSGRVGSAGRGRWESLLLLMLLLLFVGGCFAPRFEPPGELLTGLNASQACRSVSAQHASVASVRALVDATVSRSDQSGSFRYVIIGRGSDRFRIDMLPQEGAFTLGILVVRDGQTLLLDAQEKSYATAENEAELLEAFLGLRGVTRKAIIGLLTGIPPAMECSMVRVYRGSDGSLALEDSASQQVWHLNPETLVVRGLNILDQKGQRIQVTAERLALSGEYPATVTLSIFRPLEVRVEMLVRKLAINPIIPESLFSVAIPQSYRQFGE